MMAIGAMALLITACKKDAFDEKAALEAQKSLLGLKYEKEMALESLKQQGATALAQLQNNFALQQLRLNDSLEKANTRLKAELERQMAAMTDSLQRRQVMITDSLNRNQVRIAALRDYAVPVVDMVTGQPVAGATVIVSSEGRAFSSTTNAQGMAMFTSLILYPQSTFMVSRDGYAATTITMASLTGSTSITNTSSGTTTTSTANPVAVRLWANGNARNTIRGTLFIENNLTDNNVDTVGARVLVTATLQVTSGSVPAYNVVYSAFTDANGAYSISVPDASTSYTVRVSPITTNQTLFINGLTTDPTNAWYGTFVRQISTPTYFDADQKTVLAGLSNQWPGMGNTPRGYLVSNADAKGNKLYLPVEFQIPNTGMRSNYYPNAAKVLINTVGTTANYEVNGVNATYSHISFDPSFTYQANPGDTIKFSFVDITGRILDKSPSLYALVSTTNTDGLINSPSDFVVRTIHPTAATTAGDRELTPNTSILALLRNAPATAGDYSTLATGAKGLLKGTDNDNKWYGVVYNTWTGGPWSLNDWYLANSSSSVPGYRFQDFASGSSQAVSISGGITTVVNFDYGYGVRRDVILK